MFMESLGSSVWLAVYFAWIALPLDAGTLCIWPWTEAGWRNGAQAQAPPSMTDEHYLGQVFASEPLDIDYGLKKSKNAQVPIWYFFNFFLLFLKFFSASSFFGHCVLWKGIKMGLHGLCLCEKYFSCSPSFFPFSSQLIESSIHDYY